MVTDTVAVLALHKLYWRRSESHDHNIQLAGLALLPFMRMRSYNARTIAPMHRHIDWSHSVTAIQ